jgi:hypothetical protein
MAWIKRNLFFAIGGAIALALLGAAGFYDYKSWQRNSTAFENLNEIYSDLKNVSSQKPSPGNAKVDNIEAARDQERQLRAWIKKARNHFEPVSPIPNPTNGPVSSEAFKNALDRTVSQLQHEAVGANVQLPPQYEFSFTAQSDKVRFAPDSLEPLSAQLGEVRTISEILFSARINALDSVQRLRVSDDDTAGPQSDYIDDQPVKTELAVLTPYEVTFRAFSGEIAATLAAFASSPHGFIVKAINVQPAGAVTGGADTTQPPAPEAMSPGRSGLQTVLNEQLLRVTLMVEIVNLSPRN